MLHVVEEKQIYIFLALFSVLMVLCVKISVIQAVHSQYLLGVGKNQLCSEPAGSCMIVGSILPWKDLFAWM